MKTKQLLILCSICMWLIGLVGCKETPTEPSEPIPTPTPIPLYKTFQSVCEEPGRGVPNAAPYTRHERPNKIINETGGSFPNPAWNPSTVEETELVACRSMRYVSTGTCAYARYSFSTTPDCELPLKHKILDIQVRIAQTAETIGTARIEGDEQCPQTVPADRCYRGSSYTVYDSINTSNAHVATVIRRFVE